MSHRVQISHRLKLKQMSLAGKSNSVKVEQFPAMLMWFWPQVVVIAYFKTVLVLLSSGSSR